MSLVLNVEILGEFRKLTEATSGAQTQLKTLQGTAQKISNKINSAFAAIGIGLSLTAIVNGLENASKAAIADNKSQALLANTMKKSAGATDDQVDSAEAYIKQMMLSRGIADDQLRPAYQKLFLATGDVTQANKLLGIALDTSAGSGKDLDTVALAMAKSLAGSNGALGKLLPSVKDSKTPIDDLAKAFDGAATTAANLDPYNKLKIIFGEMEETIGLALLPTLDKLSTWLATPEGQEKMQDLVDFVVDLLGKFTDFVNFVLDNKEVILGWAGAIGAIAGAVMLVSKGMALVSGLEAIFVGTLKLMGNTSEVAAAKVSGLGKAFGWISLVIIGLERIVALNNILGLGTNKEAKITWGTTDTGGATNFSGQSSIPLTGNASSFSNMAPIGSGKVTTNNTTINVKSTQSAQDIAAVLARSQKTNGTTVFRGL